MTIQEVRVNEELVASIDLSSRLATAELLVGTPVITEITTSDLTISNQSVNTSILTVGGSDMAIGKAVLVKLSGWVESVIYELSVSCTTDATPNQELVSHIRFRCIPE